MNNRDRRRAQIKAKIKGSSSRPRLVVFRSSRFFYAQIIDDTKGTTLVSVEKQSDPVLAGESLAKAAKESKIEKVVFDRAGYKYHGSVKKLADAARAGGLVF